jgi:hypothetical protein
MMIVLILMLLLNSFCSHPLRSLTIDKVRGCLKNKRIIFLGDSLTRYQYINLINFLTKENWFRTIPDGTNEHKFKSWTSYFNTTTGQHSCKQICDCYREGETHPRENRFYHDMQWNITIDYYQYLSPHDIRIGINNPPDSSDFPRQCGIPKFYNDSSIKAEYNLTTLLNEFIRPTSPDILVYNQGYWRGDRSPEFISSLGDIAHSIFPTVIYMEDYHCKTKYVFTARYT